MAVFFGTAQLGSDTQLGSLGLYRSAGDLSAMYGRLT